MSFSCDLCREPCSVQLIRHGVQHCCVCLYANHPNEDDGKKWCDRCVVDTDRHSRVEELYCCDIEQQRKHEQDQQEERERERNHKRCGWELQQDMDLVVGSLTRSTAFEDLAKIKREMARRTE